MSADISMKKATSLASGNITMEWRGQQHASRAVESTASGATAAIPLTSPLASSLCDSSVQLGGHSKSKRITKGLSIPIYSNNYIINNSNNSISR